MDNKKYIRVENVIIEKLGQNEFVVFDAVRGLFGELNDCGKLIWDFIEEPRGLEEIVGFLENEFAVAPNTLKQDVNAFLNVMSERGFIDFA